MGLGGRGKIGREEMRREKGYAHVISFVNI
jgi:hypothetical protein